MPVYRGEAIIDAPPEAVWAVLLDLPRYPEWNPFTVAVSSTLQIGAPVDLTVRMEPRGVTVQQREWVRRHIPERRLDWGMTLGAPRILGGERTQVLTPMGGGRRTRYVTEDVIRGLLAPVVRQRYGPSLEWGFSAVAAALAARVEALG